MKTVARSNGYSKLRTVPHDLFGISVVQMADSQQVNASILVPSDGATHNIPDTAKGLEEGDDSSWEKRGTTLTKAVIGNHFH